MRLHANAALRVVQRRRLARRVIEEGWSLAETAKAAEVSGRTAGVGPCRRIWLLERADRSTGAMARALQHHPKTRRPRPPAAAPRLRELQGTT
jgi:hypothetical protein